MKIAYASDLHNEFIDKSYSHWKVDGTFDVDNFGPSLKTMPADVDVIVLAGDIDSSPEMYISYADALSNKFNCHVIFICGNHEYYGGTIELVDRELYINSKHNSKLHFLQDEYVIIGDVAFAGSTLWTDMRWKHFDTTIAKMDAERSMNDFRQIRYLETSSGLTQLFTGDQWVSNNLLSSVILKEHLTALKKDGTIRHTVAVTHHGPHPRCNGDGHGGGIEYCYVSDLRGWMHDDAVSPTLWISGHTHERMEFVEGNTRLLVNCHGYPGYEDMTKTFEWNNVVI